MGLKDWSNLSYRIRANSLNCARLGNAIRNGETAWKSEKDGASGRPGCGWKEETMPLPAVDSPGVPGAPNGLPAPEAFESFRAAARPVLPDTALRAGVDNAVPLRSRRFEELRQC